MRKAPAADRVPRACALVLSLAAPLVPSDVRAEWRREWLAEVGWSAARSEGSWARWALAARCLGAFVHATWLRLDRWRWELLMQDLRYAVRMLRRRPGFALLMLLTLSIGIGANAAIFSAVRSVLLRPLPYPEPERLVRLSSARLAAPDRVGGAASAPDFTDWRRDATSFDEMAAQNAGAFALTGAGPAEQVPGASVSGGFFRVLGVRPQLGRAIETGDDPVGTPDVVVLGHGLWTRRFGGDPSALGRTVTLDGVARRIVGVMPAGFEYPLGSELWLPQRFSARELTTQRGAHYLEVVARLKPGVPLERARGEMRGIAARLAAAHPGTNRDSTVSLFHLREALVGDVRKPLLMLLVAVGFVLLIACVNVANLLLTRMLGRTRELAVRAALGASRARVVRGLVVESLVLGGAGGLGGLGLAAWASRGIAALDGGAGIPLLDQARVDAPVAAFTALLSLAAVLLFGTLPAWQASAGLDVAVRLREDGTNSTGDRRRGRLRGSLIVGQTALAVVLLVGAGLLMRSFQRLAQVDLGFDPAGVQSFSIALPEAAYAQPAQRAAFVEELVARIGSRPDVAAAAAVFGLPLSGFRYSISMSTLDGRRLDDEEQDARSLQVRVVTPDYFRALGLPVVRGRAFRAADRHGAPPAVLVNEAAAGLLWPAADPLGHQFTLGTRLGQGGEPAGGTVVGVAGDVLDFGPAARARPTVYLAHAQFPVDFLSVVVQPRGPSGAPVEALRALLQQLDPELPMFRVRTMEQLAADAVARPRLYLTLLGLFAGTAVLLAAIGIYGVLAHTVGQRTREIGIRLALGADRGQVVAMVVRHAGGLAAAGLLLGYALALAATREVAGLLFGVAPTDPATYAAVGAALLLVALLAAWVPARRAARIDPIQALRDE